MRAQNDVALFRTLAAATALYAFAAGAALAPAVQAGESGPAGQERGLDTALRELPEQDLKRLYLQCGRAATPGSIGRAGIVLCSVAYEILLKRTFGGDFFALLAWSRSESKGQAEAAYHSAEPLEGR